MEQNSESFGKDDHSQSQENKQETETHSKNALKETSMTTLITWNISKAIEKNPNIDLKVAFRAAQARLDRAPHDVNVIITQFPEQRHIACALLAWKELGHKDADSLYDFFLDRQKEQQQQVPGCSKPKLAQHTSCSAKPSCGYTKIGGSQMKNALNNCKVGPVVKIPTVMSSQMEAKLSREKKISMDPTLTCPRFKQEYKVPPVMETTVMRLENDSCAQQPPSKRKGLDKDLLRKIDEVCCLESGCADRLAALDASTKDLRARAAKLARREAERSELLERAEIAWKDLERGYQRRLTLAIEKEEDITRQIQKLITERNGYKNVCSSLVNQLRDRGDAAEKVRSKLAEVEREVCERACTRLQLSEEAAKEDAALAHQQCLATQLDRDLQFKEEQARRKVSTMESELESSLTLMSECERAMRFELNGLHEQMTLVSSDLLAEDNRNAAIKEEIGKLEKLKKEMSGDLTGCKDMCDKKMQNKIDELAKKREQLEQLKEKTVECRCKEPKEVSVTVKRTPSLAALCRCTPEDKFLESCSCTSLRSSLLSNLLSDLFGGLQSELGETGLAMPCQLLKCLEDNHNWDRASNVRTKLNNFFSKLLVKELEIAISTSIENYHARWVGASCADTVRQSIPDFGDVESEGWQQRALERRAQQLAEQLAEKMFKEKTDAILQQAKDVVEKGPPPCECDKPVPSMQRGSSSTNAPSKNPSCCCSNKTNSSKPKGTALYSCLLDRPVMGGKGSVLQMTNSKLSDQTQIKPLSNRQPSMCKKVGTSFNKGLNNTNKLTVPANSSRPKSPGSSKCCNANRATGTLALDLFTKSQVLENCSPECLRQAMDDVLQLRAQIDELKKESLKKTDLMMMEKHILKMIQQTTDNLNLDSTASAHCTVPPPSETSLKESKVCPPERGPRSTTVRVLPTTAHNCLGRTPLTTNKTVKHRSKSQEKLKTKPYKRPAQLFAVNLCLCGETKAQKKIRQAKLSAPKDNPESDKISIDRAESPSNLSQESCKSDCVCLNKNPSCTSINKFLETLAKWKCDLISSDEQRVDSLKKSNYFPSSHELAENQYLGKLTLHSASNPKSTVNKISKKSYLSDKSPTRSRQEIEYEHPIPVTTESEYMGAVNLEKSNETFCRCVIAKEMGKNKSDGVNAMINSEFRINDLNSCDCCMNQSGLKNEDPSSVLNKTRIKHNSSFVVKKHSQKTKIISGDLRNSDINAEKKVAGAKTVTNTVHAENIINRNEKFNRQLTGQGEIVSRKDIPIKLAKNTPDVGKIAQNTLYPCNCDYQIKFIGVTLANETSEINEKVMNDKIACTYSAPYSPPPIPNVINTKIQNEFWTSVITQSKVTTDDKNTNEMEFNTKNKHMSCQCNDNFEEFKNLCDNTFNKEIGDFATSDDKKVDTNSIKDIQLESEEPCVCHNYVKKEESHELEVNTFNLIEEHLKEKFVKFKQHCDSCCLPHEEENKFYSTVIQKIKQVIADSANTVICQCKDDQEGQGSWNRAYDLLQEYIKAKLKRVQCACAYPESDSRNIVPEVTEKVCCLIKKDFKRLKDICDCKKTEGILQKKSNEKQKIHNKSYIEKEKMCTRNSLYDTFTKEATFHIDSSFVTKHMSSQTSINKTEHENKSCDALQKPHELIQTEDNISNMMNSYTENNCHNFTIQKKNNLCSNGDINPEKDIVSKKPEEVSEKIRYYKEKSVPMKKSAPLPFIGYTIDCSCGNNVVKCICSKSTVKNNDIKIDTMWKSYTNRKVDDTKVAYIMDNVEKIHKSDLCGNYKMNLNQTAENISLCDNETCTKCEEDIILKYSDQCWHHQDHTTNTYFQENNKIRGNLNIEDPYEWLECGSPSELEEQDLKSDCFPHDLSDKQAKNESVNTNSIIKSNNTDCNCEMVPVCHVKMLIQNIENKLTNSECVCDSMDPQACPIHLRRNMF